MSLKVDYANSEYLSKKYIIDTVSDGRISIIDATEYTVEGDRYGATDINATNSECNDVSNLYALIPQIVEKLQSKGITVANNSPAAIETAINTLAANSYTAGRTNGRNAVTSNPNRYNLYTTAQYQTLLDTNNNYKSHIRTAISYIDGGISYTSVTYDFDSQLPEFIPMYLTSTEVEQMQTALTNGTHVVHAPFTTFFTTGDGKLSDAAYQLTV